MAPLPGEGESDSWVAGVLSADVRADAERARDGGGDASLCLRARGLVVGFGVPELLARVAAQAQNCATVSVPLRCRSSFPKVMAASDRQVPF